MTHEIAGQEVSKKMFVLDVMNLVFSNLISMTCNSLCEVLKYIFAPLQDYDRETRDQLKNSVSMVSAL